MPGWFNTLLVEIKYRAAHTPGTQYDHIVDFEILLHHPARFYQKVTMSGKQRILEIYYLSSGTICLVFTDSSHASTI